jgi:hypothetical protein
MSVLPQPPQRIPVVALLCMLIFALYAASPGQAISVHCQAPQATVSHCQVAQGRRLGWLPQRATEFDWREFTLDSRLCDNTPRGGVRFCHRLTFIGANRRLTLPEWRTPLTADNVLERLTRFRSGQGPADLTWSTPQPWLETFQTLALALLLTVTTWGLGAWRRPLARPLIEEDDNDAVPGQAP